MSSKDQSSVHKLNNLVTSLINFLPPPPLGTMNILFRQYTILSQPRPQSNFKMHWGRGWSCHTLAKYLIWKYFQVPPSNRIFLLLELLRLKHHLLTSVAEHCRLAFLCMCSSVLLTPCLYGSFCCTAPIWICFHSTLFQACCRCACFPYHHSIFFIL